MISYLLILRVIKLFKADVTLFCCLVFSLQQIGKLSWDSVEMFHTTTLPLLLCILQTFPHSTCLGTFSRGQGHIHRQRYCVHTIMIVHACLSFLYMMPCLFSQPSFYSSCPYTAHRLVLKSFQSPHTA